MQQNMKDVINTISSVDFSNLNKSNNISGILKENEAKFLNYIIDLIIIFKNGKIDIRKLNDVLNVLIYMKKEQENEYYISLIKPEQSRGCKIPSRIPIPTSSFQLKNSIDVTTNSLGNVAIALVPFFLGDGGLAAGTFFVNNNNSLTGNASSNFFQSTDMNQRVPNTPGIYSNYRLVSGSIVVTFCGRMDIAQGLIGGAIIFDPSISVTNTSNINSNLQKYGNFNIVQDSLYFKQHHIIHGIREIFFPLDSSYENFIPVNTSKNGFVNFIYITKGPASTTVAKADIYLNFECIPDSSVLNYIPTSISSSCVNNKENLIKFAQKDPIMKESTPIPCEEIKIEKSTFNDVVCSLGGEINNIRNIAKSCGKFIS